MPDQEKVVRDDVCVAISHHPGVSGDVLYDLSRALNPIDVHRHAQPREQVFAGWEWVGAMLVLYILKPYFDKLRKELVEGLAETHAAKLKTVLKGFWQRRFSKDADQRASIVSRSGIKKPKYSVSFAIITVCKDGRHVQCLFHDQYLESEYHQDIDAIVDFIYQYHLDSDKQQDVLRTERPKIDHFSRVIYDLETRTIEVINDPISRIIDEKTKNSKADTGEGRDS